MKILLIEDRPDQRDLLAILLAKHGDEVWSAASVEEGLDFMNQGEVDIILLDVIAPDRDGSGLIKSLGDLNLSSRPAVLALTTSDMEEVQESLLKAGFDEVVTKPVSVAQLRNIMRTHLPD